MNNAQLLKSIDKKRKKIEKHLESTELRQVMM